MKYRKTRIACSAAGALLFLLLLILAIRSYSTLDRLRVDRNAVTSLEGRLLLNDVFNMSTTHPELMQGYSHHTFAGGRITLWIAPRGALLPVGVGKSISQWPLVVAALAAAAAPWLPWSNRFSVRTLLIVTTLAAAVMGLAVYVSAN